MIFSTSVGKEISPSDEVKKNPKLENSSLVFVPGKGSPGSFEIPEHQVARELDSFDSDGRTNFATKPSWNEFRSLW
jgi:hypothetical protein